MPSKPQTPKREPCPTCERTNYSGNGIRTRVPALRGLCPSPLDDTAIHLRVSAVARSLFHTALLAGQEGLEPPTAGFGDRCSTN